MRPRALYAALSALLFIGLVSPSPALAESAKRKQVRELLRLSGAGQLGKQVAGQLIANFRASFPDVPASYWKKLAKRLNTKELVDQIVPVYERKFTPSDLRAIIAFFKSAVGRKFVKVQPEIMAESMQIGQAWGQKIAQRVARDLKKRR